MSLGYARVDKAREALIAHHGRVGSVTIGLPDFINLLVDLMHLATSERRDFDRALMEARWHYAMEAGKPATNKELIQQELAKLTAQLLEL